MIPLRRARSAGQLGRDFSSKAAKKSPAKLYKAAQLKDDQSYVSTPHQESMIRFYRGKVPADETEPERAYRLRYAEVQLWNMRFWADNNELFHEGKKQFKSNLKQPVADEHQQEQLLPYYKSFLDSNHKRNIDYNMKWYKLQFGLLIPAVRAKLSRFVRNLKS